MNLGAFCTILALSYLGEPLLSAKQHTQLIKALQTIQP